VTDELVTSLDGEQRVAALERMSMTLGAGRDALARSYVASIRSLGSGRPATVDGADALVANDLRGRAGVLTLQDHSRRN
jgi:hypothetical protein